jgi:hypothetical protein
VWIVYLADICRRTRALLQLVSTAMRLPVLVLLQLLQLLQLLAGAEPEAARLSVFVSPAAGGDGGAADAAAAADGSAQRPYASLHRAQTAVRALLQRHGAAAGDITVHVGGGRYELGEPLVFDERDHHPAHRDSGSGHRVTWAGPPKASEEKARVLCGTALAGWQHAWGGVYKIKLGRRVWNLAENGRQSNPARHPNTNPGAGSGQLNGSASTSGFTWHEGALPANVTTFGLANTTVLMASGFDYYWTETWKVSGFNLTARTATFGKPTPMFPGDDCGYGRLFRLSAPGQRASS